MSKFIKIELVNAKDPNGVIYVNTEQISWISRLGEKAKLRLNSGDIFEVKSPSYAELSVVLELPSDSKKE